MENTIGLIMNNVKTLDKIEDKDIYIGILKGLKNYKKDQFVIVENGFIIYTSTNYKVTKRRFYSMGDTCKKELSLSEKYLTVLRAVREITSNAIAYDGVTNNSIHINTEIFEISKEIEGNK